YLAIPILAFLVISLAGGPFSAALLAAVVLLAAEELVHLLLKWLTGPLLNKIDEVRRLANDLIAQLNRLFAQQASLAQNLSPELILEMLANQVRELRDLLPDGRETELTVRLSLLRLLGGDPLSLVTTPGELPRFLSTREAVVSLTESDLIDDRYPGIYRALIKEVRLAGIFNTLPLGSTTG